MKKLYFLFIMLLSLSAFGQIYEENFDTYATDTGIDGTGNLGDYPASVTKWTLDASSATLSNNSDWIKIVNDQLSFRDVDGDAIWESQTIDISAATSAITFSLTGNNNSGGFEPADYFDVYYSIDGGAFTLISDWNGLGDAAHTILGEKGGMDWAGPTTITQSGISGASLKLRVIVNNNAGGEQIFLDTVSVFEGAASPTINFSSPANSSVFSPGTTNVNVEWVTNNTAGSETVDILVNGTLTSGVSSPYSITTTDGQTYNITINLVDGGVIDSDMISFSVASVTQVADIASLRAGTQGEFYELTGEALLTYQQSFRNQKFIEDATGAILIDDTAGNITTTYAIGDGITGIIGELDAFGGMMQFRPSQDSGVASSTGNTLTPQAVTLANLTANPEDYESELVQVTGVTMDNSTANFSGGSVHSMSQGGDMFDFRSTFFSADYASQSDFVPTATANITGIINERDGNLYYLTARDAADFNIPLLSTPNFEATTFSIYPNPTNTGSVTITSTSSDAMSVQVFDILGKQVKNQTLTNNTLNVSDLRSGVYIVKMMQNNASTTKKLVIK